MSPTVDASLAREHGLTDGEWQHVLDVLGRTPTYEELGILSVMWSEHCSYKSSRIHLKKLPTEAPWVIEGPGENAGVIDVGDGLAAVFKMESHNHPSFIEPYQGAATGVGGIMRDVFTMGARPLANLDSLRFGRPEAPRMRFLVEGVVAGIGGYGNCMGVPTVGGEVKFDASYDGNILVNAFTLGVCRTDRIFRSAAAGIGNPVVYVGSKTGRDGIHGATMASEEFGSESEAKRPRVQVGDPFTEKKLLEACLELMREDAIVAIQDMGAAGLTSSSCEMASKGGAGIEIDVSAVPRRETGMTPYEVLLSESQERMLMVIRPGTEDRVRAIFEKWELDVAVVGTVTDSGCVVVRDGEREVARLPVALIVDEAPRYDRPTRAPDRSALTELPALAPLTVDGEGPTSVTGRLLQLMGRPDIASKRWVYEQYDASVRASTVLGPGAADAAVIRLPDHDLEPQSASVRGLAMTVDMNGRFVQLDPRRGAIRGVLEAACNLACVGARPRATTDCLNFGNPERPEVMWTLVEAIEGLAEGCRALETPIVSGNVSLYNETEGRAILPTPTIGMVGTVEDVRRCPRSSLDDAGARLVLLGDVEAMDLAGSELVHMEHGELRGTLAEPDLEMAKAVHETLIEAVGAGLATAAHDAAEGGLLVALAEMAVSGRMGAQVCLPFEADLRRLFGEGPSLVWLQTRHVDEVAAVAARHGAPMVDVGAVGGDRLVVEGLMDVELERLARPWEEGLRTVLGLGDTSGVKAS